MRALLGPWQRGLGLNNSEVLTFHYSLTLVDSAVSEGFKLISSGVRNPLKLWFLFNWPYYVTFSCDWRRWRWWCWRWTSTMWRRWLVRAPLGGSSRPPAGPPGTRSHSSSSPRYCSSQFYKNILLLYLLYIQPPWALYRRTVEEGARWGAG